MTTHDTNVAVALSSYCGERYLSEQIDSVLNQNLSSDVSLTLYIRDDGSTDGTVSLLDTYNSNPNIQIIKGHNLGVVGSFFDCMKAIPETYDYIALCDQDDIWMPDKLSRALACFRTTDIHTPQLYCSEYFLCDENMENPVRSKLNSRGIYFELMLFDNPASGNTMLLNRALVNLVLRADPAKVYCHDWWIALVASALGEVFFDSNPSLYYRRLTTSVSPTGSNPINLLKYRINTFLKSDGLSRISNQIAHFSATYKEDLTQRQIDVLNTFMQGSRLSMATFPERLRGTIAGELALRILFLLGRFKF